MIRTEGLTKKYDQVTVVDDLHLHVAKGEIYGFLGPNGAGKSTTILMILGIVKPTRGTATLGGRRLDEDPFGIKRRIGVAHEQKNLYDEMRAQDYLKFFAEFYRVGNSKRRINELFDKLELSEFKNQKLLSYSKGMRQKIELARALLHDPEIIILDEPTSDLDPHGIKRIRDIILEENKRGKTILISSHIMSEIERICHRIGIMNHGKLVAEDTMSGLRHNLMDYNELEIEISRVCQSDDRLIHDLGAMNFIRDITCQNNKLIIKVNTDQDYRQEISAAIFHHGDTIITMLTKEMSLEDAFLTITDKNVHKLLQGGMNQ